MTKKILIQNLFTSISVLNPFECENKETLSSFLNDLILTLNMTIISPTKIIELPFSENYRDQNGNHTQPDDYGLTSLTAIAESHIATHSWTKRSIIYMEISSCKKFTTESVELLIHKYYPNSIISNWEFTRYL